MTNVVDMNGEPVFVDVQQHYRRIFKRQVFDCVRAAIAESGPPLSVVVFVLGEDAPALVIHEREGIDRVGALVRAQGAIEEVIQQSLDQKPGKAPA